MSAASAQCGLHRLMSWSGRGGPRRPWTGRPGGGEACTRSLEFARPRDVHTRAPARRQEHKATEAHDGCLGEAGGHRDARSTGLPACLSCPWAVRVGTGEVGAVDKGVRRKQRVAVGSTVVERHAACRQCLPIRMGSIIHLGMRQASPAPGRLVAPANLSLPSPPPPSPPGKSFL